MADAAWTAHTSSSTGKTFYYDRVSGTSTWTKPDNFGASPAASSRPTLESCSSDHRVARLLGAIARHCGAGAVPKVRPAPPELCTGGRGGAYCCASNSIHLCHENAWVSCTELAYELSHALNRCRGLTRCARDGIQVDGADCGYLGPPDVACSELRAAFWTGRCAGREGARLQECQEWHARWAVASVFPDDEHLEAHVRWARHRCRPAGADATLTDDATGDARRGAAPGAGAAAGRRADSRPSW